MNNQLALFCFLFLGFVLLVGGTCNRSGILVFSGAMMAIGSGVLIVRPK